MDAEGNPAIAEDEPLSQSEERAPDAGPPARRMNSAGDRVLATMAAADSAAEEILEAARDEARQLIDRAEEAATARTAELNTQAEVLLSRANDLTHQAQALGEATRELTSSVNRVISVEAPAVTELELPPGARGGALLESNVAEAGEPETESDPIVDELGALAEEHAQAAEPEQPAPVEQPDPVQEEAPAAPVEEPLAAPVEEEEVPPEPEPEGPAVAQEDDNEEQEDVAAEEPPKKRRSLFGRLRRRGDSEDATQAQPGARRPRASQEAIAEVSPGHQMLARQMLLDGISEQEVERRLRDEFRVQDPGAVLDSLQPGSTDFTDEGRRD